MQHLVRADRRSRPVATQLTEFAERMGFDAPLPSNCRPRSSQVTGGDGPAPGGFQDDVELANAAYGQGETFVTPLQMALVAATIANDGVLMKPHLVTAITGDGGHADDRAGATVDRSSTGRRPGDHGDAMRQAVEGDIGRQFTAGAKVPGHPDRRQVRHGRARRHRRAALVVHRVRAGRCADRRHRRARRAGRPRRRGGRTDRGRPHDPLPDGADPVTDEPAERRGARTDRRPAGPTAGATAPSRASRARSSSGSGWPRSPSRLAVMFGGVGYAAWLGGELFLAVIGGISCVMTLWVGRADPAPRLRRRADAMPDRSSNVSAFAPHSDTVREPLE